MILRYKKIHWTDHSQIKMRQYGLSKSKIMGLLRRPDRSEVGIAPGTMAVMQTNRVSRDILAKRAPGEIWLMYKDDKEIRKIISAWRYPGISKPGDNIPIPDDIRKELIGL